MMGEEEKRENGCATMQLCPTLHVLRSAASRINLHASMGLDGQLSLTHATIYIYVREGC